MESGGKIPPGLKRVWPWEKVSIPVEESLGGPWATA